MKNYNTEEEEKKASSHVQSTCDEANYHNRSYIIAKLVEM